MRGDVLERIYGIPMGILPHPGRRRAGEFCLLIIADRHMAVQARCTPADKMPVGGTGALLVNTP